MLIKEFKFREILKKYGVTKCYLGNGFSFSDDYPNGIIYVNVNNRHLYMELFKLFTKDVDGIVADDQSLLIIYNNFETVEANYIMEV